MAVEFRRLPMSASLNGNGANRARGERAFNLHLSVPPLPRYARSARTALTDFAKDHDVASLDIENLTFALGEALANAIEHAQTRQDIDVGLSINGEAIIATVHDWGRGCTTIPHGAVALPKDIAETGRGFAIMQRCTDFFDIRSAPGAGTMVTLGRYRSDRSGRTQEPLKR
jgi:anti-sigma regulatory factor (Ser/Thr protein kinase)